MLVCLVVCLLMFAASEVPAVAGESVMLAYTLDQLNAQSASETATTALQTEEKQPAAPPVESSVDSDALKQLLQLAGKKERKIIEQILAVGEQTGRIKVAKIKEKLARINVPAVVELYKDVRTLKLTKLDAARIEKIQASLAEIDASLAGKGLSSREAGDLAFFAGLARDRLAEQSQNRAEKDRLRREASSNYQQTVEQLGNETDNSSREKVADASERIVGLNYEFGRVLPLAAPSLNGKVFVTSDYGMRVHPVSRVRRFHAGIDLAGWKCDGWPVISIGPGRVVQSGWKGGYGYAIVVAHNVDGHFFYTRYAHLRQAGRASIGAVVKPGDSLGQCNNTGVSTGSHLHFEVRRNSESGPTADPKSYLPGVELLK